MSRTIRNNPKRTVFCSSRPFSDWAIPSKESKRRCHKAERTTAKTELKQEGWDL